MSSTIKCVSCKQRINLAPDASGIVTCPMCKTQQPVPIEQGQNAPQLPPQSISPSPSSAPTTQTGTDFGPIDRSTSNQSSPYSQHDFDPPKGGCGCLLAGVLIAAAVAVSRLAIV